jgi:hypothetical protein
MENNEVLKVFCPNSFTYLRWNDCICDLVCSNANQDTQREKFHLKGNFH